MVKMFRRLVSMTLVIVIALSLIGFETTVLAAEDIRFDFETGTEGAKAGSETTASAVAQNGECVVSTHNRDLSKKNVRLTLPQLDLGEGGYYMYARVKYELPKGINLASTYCMDVNKSMHGVVGGAWTDYEIKKIDITALKGRQTLSLSFLTQTASVTGVGKFYIDWIVLSQNEVAPGTQTADEESNEYVEMFKNSNSPAVRLLVSLGIMNYDENIDSFWDNSPMRRVQMADLLCKLYGLNVQKNDTPLFDDVSSDDRAVVETIVRHGYMSGCGNKSFAPDDFITGEQLIKVFVTMLGGASAAESIGGFPGGYQTIGKQLGLKYSKLSTLKGNATRMDVANIIYDAMHTDYLNISGIVGDSVIYDTQPGATFLSEVLGIYRVEGIMTGDDVTSLASSGGHGENRVVIGNRIINDPRKITTGYLGFDVVAYEKRNDDDMPGDIIYIEESAHNKVLVMDGIDNVFENAERQKATYYHNDKKKTLKMSYIVDMIYNGVAENFDLSLINSKTNDELIFVDNDGDGVYNLVIVYDYHDYLTNVIRPEENEISLQYGEQTLRMEDDVVRVFKEGIPSTIDKIESNQIISVAKSINPTGEKVYTIKADYEIITGYVDSISETSEGKKLEILGNEYYLSDYANELITKNKINDIKSGDTAKFYFNSYGKIATFEIDKSGENVACLVGYSFTDAPFSKKLQVALYTQDKKITMLFSGDTIRIDGKKHDVDKLASDRLMNEKLSFKQLIKYTCDGDVLKSITFAADGYNSTEFSRDLPYSSLRCNRTSILAEQVNGEYTAEKYRVTKNTKVFKIPVEKNLSDGKIYLDEAFYSMTSGSFLSVNKTGNVELYDVHEDGTVDYVIWGYQPYSNRISSGSSLAVINSMGKALNKDGDVVDVFYGYDELGVEISLIMRSDVVFVKQLDPTTLKKGDIIHYFYDSDGYVFQVGLRKNDETPKQVAVISSESKATSDIMLNGYVAFKSNEQFSVYTGDEKPTSPLDVEGIVSNTGTAVYHYDLELGEIFPIGFDQIEVDDQITAIVDGSNKTRMLVVYK